MRGQLRWSPVEISFFLRPNSSHSHTASLPFSSPMKAIHLPSGDQLGCCSRAPGVRVSRRVSPFSVAMLNSSPWIEIAARLPDGDRPKLSASLLNVKVSSVLSASSVVISILIGVLLALATSSLHSPKSSS